MNLMSPDLQNIKLLFSLKCKQPKTMPFRSEGIADPGKPVEPFIGISEPLFVLLESKIIEFYKQIQLFRELISRPYIEVDDGVHNHLGGWNG